MAKKFFLNVSVFIVLIVTLSSALVAFAAQNVTSGVCSGRMIVINGSGGSSNSKIQGTTTPKSGHTSKNTVTLEMRLRYNTSKGDLWTYSGEYISNNVSSLTKTLSAPNKWGREGVGYHYVHCRTHNEANSCTTRVYM